jgi:hypothetical protein
LPEDTRPNRWGDRCVLFIMAKQPSGNWRVTN